MIREDGQLYLEAGAVYVDAPGAATLTVATRWGEARDIGTRYEVRLLADDWQVQVREGRVRMADSEAGNAVVGPGERLIARGDVFQRSNVPEFDSSWSWTHQALQVPAIEGESLVSYLRWWSAESGVTVHFASAIDEQLASQTILHGSLDGLGLEEGFLVTLSSAGYRAVDWTPGEVILGR
jgi:hypothetical protein